MCPWQTAVVKDTGMPEEMQQGAVECARNIAAHIISRNASYLQPSPGSTFWPPRAKGWILLPWLMCLL
uniref:Uncharacterized protein n=1 Tax=Amazona collaria TaxID=241587 RepID=A0A8B9G4L0_9PSIT